MIFEPVTYLLAMTFLFVTSRYNLVMQVMPLVFGAIMLLATVPRALGDIASLIIEEFQDEELFCLPLPRFPY